MKRIFIFCTIIWMSCFYTSTVAEASYFDTIVPSISLVGLSSCQGYNAQENIGSVSPLLPLRLAMVSNWSTIDMSNIQVNLDNPDLGSINTFANGLVEISFKQPGVTTVFVTTTLWGQVVHLAQMPIVFVPEKAVTINLFHVYDPKGYAAWNLDQEKMIAVLQSSEAILNQAGVSIRIGKQENIYLPTSIGNALDASDTGLSAEESMVLSQESLDDNSLSILVIWDYKIANQSKAGITFSIPGKGKVMFITAKSTKPQETLAHEIMHSIGIDHTTQSPEYLMYPEERAGIDQCLFSLSELEQLTQTW